MLVAPHKSNQAAVYRFVKPILLAGWRSAGRTLTTAYPDTSFLCAFYVKQANSPPAPEHAATMREPLLIVAFLAYEFRESVRFQTWRDIPRIHVAAWLQPMPRKHWWFQLIFRTRLRLAEDLLQNQTAAHGHRSLDVLHVATALHLGAKEFHVRSIKCKLVVPQNLTAKTMTAQSRQAQAGIRLGFN